MPTCLGHMFSRTHCCTVWPSCKNTIFKASVSHRVRSLKGFFPHKQYIHSKNTLQKHKTGQMWIILICSLFLWCVVNPDLTDTQFPDQSSTGSSKNELGRILLHKAYSGTGDGKSRCKRRNGADSFRRELEKQKIIFKMRAMSRLLRKQEMMHKKNEITEIIELHDFSFELQMLTSELETMELQTLVTKL